ncbi:hypothetical protein T07_677 [Trichinella nelsoni]|uniref:Uncharacterized protein n=2 Tax=Trichinella TaxID=6333 RepID=A0A0V1D7Q7_TRIBR|nr:hypothetical protein T07_677 [Trichinella nelsoni]KRY57630.1 hypothetical protein T03_17184 [Trichinella britovi]KRZ86235.1 hypothetical protein T08_11701 [Trichinella sp. T8]
MVLLTMTASPPASTRFSDNYELREELGKYNRIQSIQSVEFVLIYCKCHISLRFVLKYLT